MPFSNTKIQQLEADNLRLAAQNRELQKRTKILADTLGEKEEVARSLALLNAELACVKDHAVRANQASRHFLVQLSHEIRTPMTGMLAMIDFTLDSELKPEQECQLKIARKAGKELVKVINDMLEFAHIGSAASDPVAAAAPPAAAPPALHIGAFPRGALTVLVAEDDHVIMEVMTRLISRAGHRVLTAWDGEEALRLWESERPHLVLMDVQMPNLDGLETTRRIRARERDTGAQVPIYGITAHILEEDVKSCLVAGMNGHLGKPIDFPDVLEILGRHQMTEH